MPVNLSLKKKTPDHPLMAVMADNCIYMNGEDGIYAVSTEFVVKTSYASLEEVLENMPLLDRVFKGDIIEFEF